MIRSFAIHVIRDALSAWINWMWIVICAHQVHTRCTRVSAGLGAQRTTSLTTRTTSAASTWLCSIPLRNQLTLRDAWTASFGTGLPWIAHPAPMLA